MEDAFLSKRLGERKEQHSLRSLKLTPQNAIDFCSNDYLGVVKNNLLVNHKLQNKAQLKTGSTGSRLLSGNYDRIVEAEKLIAVFHEADAALIFNSGYDANLGLLSCVPQRNDVILYDSLSHASIRDGVRLSFAQSFSFLHNNLIDLQKKLEEHARGAERNVFIVTESLFSMDGDFAPLNAIVELCRQFNAKLIVDEAHATGVFGLKGEGLVQLLRLQEHCFARVHTFGKALGTHGAAVLGSDTLKQYLINFCRSFIYTTALPESTSDDIINSYDLFPTLSNERAQLTALIEAFQSLSIKYQKIESSSPIQAIIIPGNEAAKAVAGLLQQHGLDIRPILYPTVPKGIERLRVILHSFNAMEQIKQLAGLLN